MAVVTVARKLAPKRLPAGTTVEVRLQGRTVQATVLEDLGPIGPDPRHVVRLAAQLEPGEELTTFDLAIDVESLPI